MTTERPKVLFVVGPTATGKSDIAIRIAQKLNAEIINCDSIQVYQGIEIGTAKPSREQLAMVPHHLVSYVPEGKDSTAGDYREAALKIIDQRFKAGQKLFLVVGGSGFYVQALEKGMFSVPDVPPEVREALDEELEQKGREALFAELQKRDPDYASRIKPQDTYRILRALELLRTQNKSMQQIRDEFSVQTQQPPFDFRKMGITRDRDLLRTIVGKRTQAMLAQPWIEEVKSLRARGLGEWAPMRSVGYQEIQEMLDGRLHPDQLEERISISTMQLAKRQMTWFKRDPQIRWFDGQEAEAAVAYASACFDEKPSVR